MPIFEYKCGDCGKLSSILVRSGNGKGQKCPECGSKKMAKQMSSFAGVVKESNPQSNCQSCCQSGMCPNAQL